MTLRLSHSQTKEPIPCVCLGFVRGLPLLNSQLSRVNSVLPLGAVSCGDLLHFYPESRECWGRAGQGESGGAPAPGREGEGGWLKLCFASFCGLLVHNTGGQHPVDVTLPVLSGVRLNACITWIMRLGWLGEKGTFRAAVFCL